MAKNEEDFVHYVRSLDGLRGIAVLLVVMFHYGYFAAGWIGVQVFFTLSGFLISSILLPSTKLPLGSYLSRFYWRRALRIFPLYFFFAAVMACCYAWLRCPASFGADWPYLLTYTINVERSLPGDVGHCFVHLWSLALEEQFYLVWPLLVYFAPVKLLKRIVILVLALCPLLRLAVFLAALHGGADAAYAGRLVYVLPCTQIDSFATGAAICLWGMSGLARAGRIFLTTFLLGGLLGCLVLVANQIWHGAAFVASLGYAMYMTTWYQYVWGYSLLNAISALAIICALQGLQGATMLEHPILVYVGRISYGVYMYHVPLLVLLRQTWGPGGSSQTQAFLFLPFLSVVLLVSQVSFRYLETPFLKLKDWWKRDAFHLAEETSAR